jgi:hypothetical protein
VVEVTADGEAWAAFPHALLGDPADAGAWLGFAGLAPVALHVDDYPVDPAVRGRRRGPVRPGRPRPRRPCGGRRARVRLRRGAADPGWRLGARRGRGVGPVTRRGPGLVLSRPHARRPRSPDPFAPEPRVARPRRLLPPPRHLGVDRGRGAVVRHLQPAHRPGPRGLPAGGRARRGPGHRARGGVGARAVRGAVRRRAAQAPGRAGPPAAGAPAVPPHRLLREEPPRGHRHPGGGRGARRGRARAAGDRRARPHGRHRSGRRPGGVAPAVARARELRGVRAAVPVAAVPGPRRVVRAVAAGVGRGRRPVRRPPGGRAARAPAGRPHQGPTRRPRAGARRVVGAQRARGRRPRCRAPAGARGAHRGRRGPHGVVPPRDGVVRGAGGAAAGALGLRPGQRLRHGGPPPSSTASTTGGPRCTATRSPTASRSPR